MYLDSPFERCERCRTYVLMDQSVEEYAREHGCLPEFCPLVRFLSGRTFKAYARPKVPERSAA